MARADFTFTHPLRVRWAEADMQGVVFNGHYLTYFDVGITEYWRAIFYGDAAQMRETLDRLYVVKSTVEYHASANFDDALDVCVRIARLGRSSIRVLFELHRGGAHLVSGENVYVHTHAGRSEPLPEALRVHVQRFERTPLQD